MEPNIHATADRAPVAGVDALLDTIKRVRAAQKIFATYTQEQVDKIFLAAATAADKARISLAKQAVAETGMGISTMPTRRPRPVA